MGFTANSVISRFFPLCKKKSHKREPRTPTTRKWAFPELCRRFSLAEIVAATEGFDSRLHLGTGTLASVYKGSINDGATVVAVKRLTLDDFIYPFSAFETEVLMFCQLGHPNLVSFIGFCKEEDECILVYEYMPNGALSDYLFRASNHQLSWKQRLNICIGAARAIHYLHTGVKHSIIHGDIKSLNILLDDSFMPKLSSFGLSKKGPPNLSNEQIKVDSAVAGTMGYLDPEYAQSGQLTLKSDVFSFGMVLFEVFSAKLAILFGHFLGRVTVLDIMDPFLVGKIAPDCLQKFMAIAERCVRPAGAERPTMGEVLVELENASELQDTADAIKMLGASTSLGASHDYTYEGITFRAISDIFFWFTDETSNDVVDHSIFFF